MWRVSHFISGLMRAGLATACLVSLAVAGDIPAPVKKPRDKTGAVVTKSTAEDQVTAPAAPEPVTTKSKTVTAKAAKDQAKAAPREEAKAVAPDKGLAKKAGASEAATASASASVKAVPSAAAPPENSAAAAPPAVPKEWSAEEIDAAKAHCADVLKSVDAVSVPEPPFREGECGAPAAVRLISIGKNPQVSLSPPALLTCDMVSALHTWLKQDVQPLAKARLGSEIIKIETMSDYSCRNAYGRVGSKLSEHGHANALDIRGFVTANAKTAYVLESWGPTKQDLIARIAAAKAAEAKAAAESDAKQASTGSARAEPAISPAPATAAHSLPALRGAQDRAPETSLGFEPAHLGGPKDKDKKQKTGDAKAPAMTTPKADKKRADEPATEAVGPAAPEQAAPLSPSGSPTAGFLKLVHASACTIFGTTLGPEANAAHRNHFHVDMAPRKTKKICD